MRIGLLCSFYNCAEKLEQILSPWLTAIDEKDLEIAVVHGQFKEYHDMGFTDSDEHTISKILSYKRISFTYIQSHNPNEDGSPKYESEAVVRNYGLQYLLSKDLDVIILLDSDEFYTSSEISKMLEYVRFQELVTWFRIEFKNLIFDEHTYVKGFAPPRIFRTKSPAGYVINKIYWDNDVSYLDAQGNIFTYESLAFAQVPVSICNPLHYTWLNNENSRRKVLYQEKHFAHGAGSSFKWDKDKGLVWNDNYYIKLGISKPELFTL